MSRDTIFNFQPIFTRADFDYISNIDKIFFIVKPVLISIQYPSQSGNPMNPRRRL